MPHFKNKISLMIHALVVALILSLAIPEEGFSRRGGFGGGGFRSSRSRSASSWGNRSKAKSTWGSKPKRTSSRGTSSKIARSTTGRGSKADKALYQKAKANGTTFKTRKEAQSSFQKNHGSKYPSKYSQQPSQRPSHIPNKTTVDGRNVDVTYNRAQGGYGYYSPGGGWMMYSVVRDVTMMSMLMGHHGYYYGGPPGEGGGGGMMAGFFGGIFSLLRGAFVIMAIVFLARSLNRM